MRRRHNALRSAVALLLAFAVSGCAGAIPRPGPNKSELFETSVLRSGDAYIVQVDQQIAAAVDFIPEFGFDASFRDAQPIAADAIRPGDTLGMTIWENVEDGLLSVGGVPAPLTTIQVDGNGFIFVPYAGRVEAAGRTPEQLRNLITSRLETQTPDPQVLVTRVAGDGATVSVSGMVGAQGVYPIERPTRRLSSMLARAGGVTVEPEIAIVTVIRGGKSGRIWFNALFESPTDDIALRAGDRILVEADERFYTALGATGQQSRIRFESQELSAMEALAQVGGLSTLSADPTGIFLLREEPPEVASRILGDASFTTPQKVAYIFNLTQGESLFAARNFTIRDEDTIFVTEAPVSQFNKAVSAVFGSLTTVASIQTIQNRR